MQAKKAIVTDAVLIQKGKELADRRDCTDFVPDVGWLSRVKTRNGISLRTPHGESASVNVGVVSTTRSELKHVLEQYQYIYLTSTMWMKLGSSTACLQANLFPKDLDMAPNSLKIE